MSQYTVRATSRGRTVRADYHGGPYIELTFGGGYRPTEVINVWSYDKGAVADDRLVADDRKIVLAAIRIHLLEWMNEMDEEWPEWHQEYLRNAAY